MSSLRDEQFREVWDTLKALPEPTNEECAEALRDLVIARRDYFIKNGYEDQL
jgi:hypothetical protein